MFLRMSRLVSADALAAAVLAASCALAFAGSLPGPILTVKIPFDFHAGESRFGPGEYVISLNGDASQDVNTAGSVKLESRDRGRSVSIHARRSAPAGRHAGPVVSFRAYGDQRFLASVHAGGAGGAWEITPSADEKSASVLWGAHTLLSLKAEPLPPSNFP